jgi:hypothetical protein
MTRTIRTTTQATALAIAALMTACTNHTDPPAVLPSTTPTTSATSPPTAAATPTGTPQQQAVDTYLGMQHAFTKAGEVADPSYPDLPKYASGPALQLLTTGLTSMRTKGLRARGQTIYHPKVESIEPASAPTRARVRDCIDTSNAVAYKANGDPYKDTPGGLRLVIADLTRTGHAWKVTGLGVHEVGSCVL